ncbi:F-box domain-containing protein [Mycena indigotica]|uniref:F-box domain-containing protein n=1 Tax=Mycena indigotica TaxID=2126181 RepID=A0A8H6WBI0_9AGAR|nr:F-box domain-containing protein [Mycena indigotica]KAF7311837.1 F-box domain-containing protein [Mycena indigotica]
MAAPHELAGTNAVPTEEQAIAIRQTLFSAKQHIQSLQDELANLTAQLAHACKHRDELEAPIREHQALTSAARRLPDVVLRAIFISTLPTHRNASFASDEGPYLLCRVSRRWRALAMDTPCLWASMHVVIPRAEAFLPMIDTLRLWLSRSTIDPLSVSVCFPKAVRTRSPLVTSLLAILVGHAPRWQKMRVVVYEKADVDALTQLTATDLPILQDFDITIQHGISIPSIEIPFAFLRTPSLRRLTISQLPQPDDVLWGRLVHLEFHASISNLIHFSLYAGWTWPRDAPSDMDFEPIRLPLLSEFRILFSDSLIVGRTLEKCEFPSLHRLSVQSRWPQLIIGDLGLPQLSAASPGLKSLELTAEGMQRGALEAALHALPQLEELTLSGEPLYPPTTPQGAWTRDLGFFDALASPALCAALRKLVLRDIRRASDAQLLAVVRARCRGRLREFRCQLQRPLGVDLREELRKEIARGLQLKVEVLRDAQLKVYTPLERTERAPMWPHWSDDDDD